jgi:hypothetical protein
MAYPIWPRSNRSGRQEDTYATSASLQRDWGSRPRFPDAPCRVPASRLPFRVASATSGGLMAAVAMDYSSDTRTRRDGHDGDAAVPKLSG